MHGADLLFVFVTHKGTDAQVKSCAAARVAARRAIADKAADPATADPRHSTPLSDRRHSPPLPSARVRTLDIHRERGPSTLPTTNEQFRRPLGRVTAPRFMTLCHRPARRFPAAPLPQLPPPPRPQRLARRPHKRPLRLAGELHPIMRVAAIGARSPSLFGAQRLEGC